MTKEQSASALPTSQTGTQAKIGGLPVGAHLREGIAELQGLRDLLLTGEVDPDVLADFRELSQDASEQRRFKVQRLIPSILACPSLLMTLCSIVRTLSLFLLVAGYSGVHNLKFLQLKLEA